MSASMNGKRDTEINKAVSPYRKLVVVLCNGKNVLVSSSLDDRRKGFYLLYRFSFLDAR